MFSPSRLSDSMNILNSSTLSLVMMLTKLLQNYWFKDLPLLPKEDSSIDSHPTIRFKINSSDLS